MLRHAEELFEEGDTNHDGRLSSAELQALLIKARPVALLLLMHLSQSPQQCFQEERLVHAGMRIRGAIQPYAWKRWDPE